ncbi:MAG: hypothetical protein LW870_16975 [Pirellula sp.]|jgi:hypothetical protein|nr:hypothetical protein [Pirellula sp.]
MLSSKFAVVCSGLFVMIAGFMCPPRVFAHPFHVCVGQMTWNAESKHWEVSLRLHPQDLERSMKAWRTSSLPPNSTPAEIEAALKGCSLEEREFEELVVSYLDSQFFLRRAPMAMQKDELEKVLNSTTREAKDFSKLKWVGREQEKGWLWIHLEMQPPEADLSVYRVWLCHQLFMEAVSRQENSVVVQPTKQIKYSLEYKKGNLLHPLR